MHTIEGQARLIIDKSEGKVVLRFEITLPPLEAVEASMVLTTCARNPRGSAGSA
jgi:hypothetical protein